MNNAMILHARYLSQDLRPEVGVAGSGLFDRYIVQDIPRHAVSQLMFCIQPTHRRDQPGQPPLQGLTPSPLRPCAASSLHLPSTYSTCRPCMFLGGSPFLRCCYMRAKSVDLTCNSVCSFFFFFFCLSFKMSTYTFQYISDHAMYYAV